MKLANKLEAILDRRGVTIEGEETTVPSVRKKAPRKGRKALSAGDAKQSRSARKGKQSRDASP